MQINSNKSVPKTGGTFTGPVYVSGTGSLAYLGTETTYGGTWHSGVTVYGDKAATNLLTVFDTEAMAAGVGGQIVLGGKYKADGTYTDFAAIEGVKANAVEADNAGQIIFSYAPTSGTWAQQWVMKDQVFYPVTTGVYALGAPANRLTNAYVTTAFDANGTTTYGAAGITKYNNIATAGSGTAPIYGSIALANQSASIGTTNLYAAAPAGLYRICWRQKITTPAGTSSSLLVTIGWNDGAARTSTMWVDPVAGTTGTTADATNTSTGARGNCITIYSAAGQNITYATTYASNAAGAMKYSLDMTVEKLN